jgi:phosphoserine aminotransferase
MSMTAGTRVPHQQLSGRKVAVARKPVAAAARKTMRVMAVAEKERLYNFSAGPAMLPMDVLERARDEMVDWNGSGMSVMEMSHRGKEFMGIASKTEADLRTLLAIPDNYKVLFMQGGASSQFSAIPLNLVGKEDTVDVLVTGSWSKKAAGEMKKFCKVNIATDGKAEFGSYCGIPEQSKWTPSAESKYVVFCDNETIEGVEFAGDPEMEGKTLIKDVSSNFMSKPINIAKYGVVYGGVQKNIGPAGMALVIVREDLLNKARDDCPAMLDWTVMAENDSMYNTPPCYTIYMCGLVFEKLLAEGGLDAMAQRNADKSKLVYDVITGSDGFYKCPTEENVQSKMNIPFTLANADLDKAFLAEASEQGLVTLKGHRSVGGMRASVYNAMPKEGCAKLAAFMKEFQAKNA